MSRPFISSHYVLNSCQLCELAQEEAIALGQNLSEMPPWNILNYSADKLSTYLSRPDSQLYRYGIHISEQLIGTVCIRYPWLHGAYLELLGIYPTLQGQGLGREIIQWMENEARSTNLRNLWALVSSFNHHARNFYQKMGFIEIGQLEDFMVTGYHEMFLRKKLI